MLWLYRGNGIGGFIDRVQIGHGWQSMDVIVGAGDVDLDGVSDLVTRRVTRRVLTYPGRAGRRAPGHPSALARADLVTAVGDWDGDGLPDVVTRVRATGELQLRAGDGRGGLGQPRTIGTGWGGLTTVVGTGDFDGDGGSDLLVTTSSGRLTLYRGDGTGGFADTLLISRGWGALTLAN